MDCCFRSFVNTIAGLSSKASRLGAPPKSMPTTGKVQPIRPATSSSCAGFPKLNRFCVFEVDKKPLRSWREVVFEELAIGTSLSDDLACDQTRHDLARIET